MRDANLVDLAAMFHIRPWETDDLTVADLTALVEVLTAMRQERARGK